MGQAFEVVHKLQKQKEATNKDKEPVAWVLLDCTCSFNDRQRDVMLVKIRARERKKLRVWNFECYFVKEIKSIKFCVLFRETLRWLITASETPPAESTPDEGEKKIEAQKIEAGSIEGSIGSASLEDKTDVSYHFCQ